MRLVLVIGDVRGVLVGCREQNDRAAEARIKPPRSAAKRRLMPVGAPRRLIERLESGWRVRDAAQARGPQGAIIAEAVRRRRCSGRAGAVISIETIGNVASVMIPRARSCRVAQRSVLDEMDDQDRVEVPCSRASVHSSSAESQPRQVASCSGFRPRRAACRRSRITSAVDQSRAC